MLIITVVILLLGAAVLGLGWWGLHPQIDETSGPVTREAAIKILSSELLPVSAYDIEYHCEHVEVSPTFEICVRFRAPLRDCMMVAHKMVAGIGSEPVRVPMSPKLAVKLLPSDPFDAVSHPKLPNNPDLPHWFDPNHIEKGVMAGKGYEGEPQIWIDEERGIFYYYLTD